MFNPRPLARRTGITKLLLACSFAALPIVANAQDEASIPSPADTLEASAPESAQTRYLNHIAGEFTPAKGFDVMKTRRGSLNISGYGLFRYINQMPGEQTYTDHLGRVRTVKARNDLNWHRTP